MKIPLQPFFQLLLFLDKPLQSLTISKLGHNLRKTMTRGAALFVLLILPCKNSATLQSWSTTPSWQCQFCD